MSIKLVATNEENDCILGEQRNTCEYGGIKVELEPQRYRTKTFHAMLEKFNLPAEEEWDKIRNKRKMEYRFVANRTVYEVTRTNCDTKKKIRFLTLTKHKQVHPTPLQIKQVRNLVRVDVKELSKKVTSHIKITPKFEIRTYAVDDAVTNRFMGVLDFRINRQFNRTKFDKWKGQKVKLSKNPVLVELREEILQEE